MRIALACLAASLGLGAARAEAPVPPTQRVEAGNRVSENIPEIPADLLERLNRYQNTRGASFGGWTRDGCILIGTRFAETTQAHRVCQPLGMREQLTFYPEPLGTMKPAPAGSPRDGFIFGKDVGGSEFSQLYWFDLKTRETTLLTDGKSRNDAPLFTHDGGRMAWTSTARNGTDFDIWLQDLDRREPRTVVTEGGLWTPTAFSPDGKRMLVIKFVSATETYPGEVDLETGKLRLFPVDGGKAAITDIRYAPDGRAVYYLSDEPVDGKPSEFRTLRHHDPDKGAPRLLTASIPWDIDELELADDGRHLAYVSNEDGIAVLHVLRLPGHEEIELPVLPVGAIGGMGFSPDGRRIAVTLNTATSPNDVYVIELADAKLVRWTRSEVGGLDAAKFVSPTLVRFPTFDRDGDAPRTIPAFYYRAAPRAGGKSPVVIQIHGGPESQSGPTFSATIQYLVRELGISVLVPNVRGSTGYGRTYLDLDNATKREDSVRDIGALLDWIEKQPELDAGRVGVTGGSYGGYMVLAALVHYSDRIRAGVEIVGISHFGTFLENTEDYRRDLRRVEYGDERDPEIKAYFDRISPLNNVAKIRSPLFVAQGFNDPRVPHTEAEQIVKAMREKGTPAWYLLFKDEGHGFKKKANSDYFGAATMLFWQQYLLPASGT